MNLPEHLSLSDTDEAAIRNAAGRLGLIKPGFSKLEAFCSLEGESEHSRTYFFQEDHTLFSVRTGSKDALLAMWDQIDKYRTVEPVEALLPVAGNVRSDGIVIYNDGLWMRKVLKRLRLLRPSGRLLAKHAMSGFAGFSRLYIVHIPSSLQSSAHTVLVKFDHPDRNRLEWDAIEAIRLAGDLPKELQLPFNANSRKDRLIVSPLFQGVTASGFICQAKEFLEANLLPNFGNVIQFGGLVEDFLSNLYKDAEQRYEATVWKDHYPELYERSEFLLHLVNAKGIALLADRERFIMPALPHVGLWTNLLYKLERHLDQDTGRLVTANVHGDLQSTNILVARDQYEAAKEIRIVDLEKFGEKKPIIQDLVRFEVDFWRSIVTSRNLEHFNDRDEKGRRLGTLQAITLAMDRLDNRGFRTWPLDHKVVQLANAAGRFIASFREYACRVLRQREGQKVSANYFQPLRFYYLRALIHAFDIDDDMRARTLLLCASLTEETRRTLSGELGGRHMRLPQEWTEIPQVEVGHRLYTLPSAAEDRTRRRSSKGFGRATAAFGQTGLLVSATEEFLAVRNSELHLYQGELLRLGDDYTFVDTRDLARRSRELNASAFKDQQWRGTSDTIASNRVEKTERNFNHSLKNPFCLLMVKAFAIENFVPTEQFIGFSHVIPLTPEGYQAYCDGQIRDNEFSAELIARPGEIAVALLLFSLAADCSSLSRAYRELKDTKRLAGWKFGVVKCLLRALATQVLKLMKVHGDVEEIILLVQNDSDRGIQGALDYFHFGKSALMTADGHNLRSLLCRRTK